MQIGATTDDVDRACHEAAVERGAYPSPLNYFGFPKRYIYMCVVLGVYCCCFFSIQPVKAGKLGWCLFGSYAALESS